MKKLMVAVIAVAMATAANAAYYTWGMRESDNVDHNGTVQTTGSALLFTGVIGQTDNGDGTYSLDFSGATFITSMTAPYYDSVDEVYYIGESSPSKSRSSALIDDKYAGEASTESQAFAILVTEKTGVNGDNYSDFEGYYYVATGDSVGASDGDLDINYVEYTSWESVDASTWKTAATGAPEPTSGLLLLIGMAGLALRRRRA